MSQNNFSIADFKEHLETYGTNLARWPGDARLSAEDLMAHSTEAQDLFANTASADDALGLPPSIPLPADLLEKILKKSGKT